MVDTSSSLLAMATTTEERLMSTVPSKEYEAVCKEVDAWIESNKERIAIAFPGITLDTLYGTSQTDESQRMVGILVASDDPAVVDTAKGTIEKNLKEAKWSHGPPMIVPMSSQVYANYKQHLS